MPKLVVPAVSLFLLGSVLVPFAQERVKAKGPADFKATLTAAQTHWDAARYGQCIGELQTAIGLVSEKRAEALLAAFPPAPAGWKVLPDKSRESMQQNPFAAMMSTSIGNIIERKYQAEKGGASMSCTLTADSPLAQMFGMWVANPAMLEPGSELIKYGPHNAVLKNQDGNLNLQILVQGKHVLEIDTRKMTEDELFAVWNQKAVDELAKVLGS